MSLMVYIDATVAQQSRLVSAVYMLRSVKNARVKSEKES